MWNIQREILHTKYSKTCRRRRSAFTRDLGQAVKICDSSSISNSRDSQFRKAHRRSLAIPFISYTVDGTVNSWTIKSSNIIFQAQQRTASSTRCLRKLSKKRTIRHEIKTQKSRQIHAKYRKQTRSIADDSPRTRWHRKIAFNRSNH